MRSAPLVLGLLALAACGGEGDEAQPSPTPATELRVSVWPEGRPGEPLRATLTCDPAGGDHPDPEGACRALRAHADALEPVPADAICTQIFGGPDEARVEGTLDGRPVDASFDRRNGCEIARWDRLAPLLSLQRP